MAQHEGGAAAEDVPQARARREGASKGAPERLPNLSEGGEAPPALQAAARLWEGLRARFG